MISGVNIISGKASIVSVNGARGLGSIVRLSARVLGGEDPLKIFRLKGAATLT